MHCLLNEEISELAQALTNEEIVSEDRLANLLKTSVDQFLSNAVSRLFQLSRKMRKCKKTESSLCKKYLRKIKKAFMDLQKLGNKFEDKVIGIAMIDGTNLDAGKKLNIESVARNLDKDRKLIPKHVADSIKRLMAQDAEEKVLEVSDADNEGEPESQDTLWVQQRRVHGRYSSQSRRPLSGSIFNAAGRPRMRRISQRFQKVICCSIPEQQKLSSEIER